MTNVVNMHEDVNKVAYGDLNIGDIFESYGKLYIKYADNDFEGTFALQIYPPDNLQFHSWETFSDEELVSERQCTITIE